MDKILKRIGSQEEYYAAAKEEAEYVDECFPQTKASILGLHGAKKDLVEMANKIVWTRAREQFQGKPYAIFQDIEVNDIQQRALGDCYFLCSVAALAEDIDRVQKLFTSHTVNSSGCYPVEVYILGRKVMLLLDEYVPVLNTGQWCFVEPSGEELWVVLLEKAWARVNGSYARIESGNECEALSFLTGAPCQTRKHKEITALEDYWKFLLSASEKKYIMTASGGSGPQSDEACKAAGIISHHAYSLLRAIEINHNGTRVRLLKMRNPWGHLEWNGDWGDDWSGWSPELKNRLNHQSSDDGTFYIAFDDFMQYFSDTTVCSYKPQFVHSTVDVEDLRLSAHAFEVTQSTHGYIGVYQMSERMVGAEFPDYEPPCLFLVIAQIVGDKVKLVNWTGCTNFEGHAKVHLQPGRYLVLSGAEYVSPMARRYAVHAYLSYPITFVKCSWETEVLAELGLQIARGQEAKYDKSSEDVWSFDDCTFAHCLGIYYYANPQKDRLLKITVNYQPRGLRMLYPEEGATKFEKSLAPDEDCVVLFTFTSTSSVGNSQSMSMSIRSGSAVPVTASDKIPPYLAEVHALLDVQPKPQVKPKQPFQEPPPTIMPHPQPQPQPEPQPEREPIQAPEPSKPESGPEPQIQPQLTLEPVQPAEPVEPAEPQPAPEPVEPAEPVEPVEPHYHGGQQQYESGELVEEPPYRQHSQEEGPERSPEERPEIQPPEPQVQVGVQVPGEDEKKVQPELPSDRTRCCGAGHELGFNFSSYPGGVYACDLCRSAHPCREGRWHCVFCQYDVCASCRAPPPLQCFNRHPLSYSTELPGAQSYCCVFCEQSEVAERGLLTCRACDFDVCLQCVNKLADPEALKAVAERRTSAEPSYVRCCANHHPLSFSFYGYGQGQYRCNVCRELGLCQGGRWFCHECQYDLCHRCRPPPPNVPDHDVADDQKCPARHNLRFGTYVVNALDFTCARGKHKRQCTDGAFYCAECQYIVCQDCMPVIYNPAFTKLDARGHPFFFRVGRPEHNAHFRCDVCGKGDRTENGSLRCNICDFDMCVKCLLKKGLLTQKPPCCEAGHTMECSYAGSVNGAKDFRCRSCEQTRSFSAGRWYCVQCNVAICSVCRPLVH